MLRERQPKLEIAVLNVGMLLTSIAAVVISFFALEYARRSAEAASKSTKLQIAQLRPQLLVLCSNLKKNGDSISGAFSIRNLGPTTAVIDDVKIVLYSDETAAVFQRFLERAIVHKDGLRDQSFTIPQFVEFKGKKFACLDQIRNRGGISFEVRYRSKEIGRDQFIDSLIVGAGIPTE